MAEVFVVKQSELAELGRKVVSVDGLEIGLFQVGDHIFAWRNHCPHQGGPACQGKLMRGVEERLTPDKQSLGIFYNEYSLNIICPWHGYEFDVRTGHYAGAGEFRLMGYPVTLKDGGVYVSI